MIFSILRIKVPYGDFTMALTRIGASISLLLLSASPLLSDTSLRQIAPKHTIIPISSLDKVMENRETYYTIQGKRYLPTVKVERDFIKESGVILSKEKMREIKDKRTLDEVRLSLLKYKDAQEDLGMKRYLEELQERGVKQPTYEFILLRKPTPTKSNTNVKEVKHSLLW
jgi:hypothetical protein